MHEQAGGAPYTVVIADIVRSRRQTDAAGLQAALEMAARELSAEHRGALAADVTVSSGDELQVLLREPGPAFELVFDVADRLHPLRARFGVGRGRLDTPLRKTTGSLSGPAFYGARDALKAARRRGWHIAFEGFEDVDTLGVLGDCALAIVAGWTAAQRDSARAYMEHGTHESAAESLGLARSTVTRNLHRGLVSQAIRCRDRLGVLLSSERAVSLENSL